MYETVCRFPGKATNNFLQYFEPFVRKTIKSPYQSAIDKYITEKINPLIRIGSPNNQRNILQMTAVKTLTVLLQA